MRKFIKSVLIVVILSVFTACPNTDNRTSLYMAKVYCDYLTSLGAIETERGSTVGNGFERWNVYDLYYYLDDFNGDGTMDLAISAEISDSNGIEIYTYEGEQVKKLFSKGMPYSAGSEIFTLAKYDDMYGIKRFRQNSMGDFSFYRINNDGTTEMMFDGELYDIDGNALDTSDSYDKINPITFFDFEELKELF